jgi:hypothetical protein
VGDVEGFKEGVEEGFVEAQAVLDVEGFIREAVAWEVDGDGPMGFGEGREDVAVEVAGGWEAVGEEDWGD